MAVHFTQSHCRFFISFPLAVHFRWTHDKQLSQLTLDSWLSSISPWQTLHIYVQFCCLTLTTSRTHFHASTVKNRLIVERQTLSLTLALSTCSGIISTISSVNFLPARAAVTWLGDTNHDSTLSSFLLGTRSMNATHPTFRFFFGNPTTVFSLPFGLPRFLMRYGSLIDARSQGGGVTLWVFGTTLWVSGTTLRVSGATLRVSGATLWVSGATLRVSGATLWVSHIKLIMRLLFESV